MALLRSYQCKSRLTLEPSGCRDVNNTRDTLARFAPELSKLHYGEEMWALFEKGEPLPEMALTGKFKFATGDADVGAVLMSIEVARQEAQTREQGRQAAAEAY